VESSIVASTSSPFGRADGGVAVLIFEPDRPSHVHQVGPSVVISVYNTGSLFQRRSVFSVRLWWPGCQHAASDRHRYAEVPTARRTDLCSSAPSQPPLYLYKKKKPWAWMCEKEEASACFRPGISGFLSAPFVSSWRQTRGARQNPLGQSDRYWILGLDTSNHNPA